MPNSLRFSIRPPDGVQFDFMFTLNMESLEIELGEATHRPEWTELSFCRCPHCPLTEASHCPVAVNISTVVVPLGALISYETVTCQEVTEERTTVKTTSAQEAIQSIVMFVTASSACPHTHFFKPMARFHLPFSTLDEVVARTIGTYLVFQHLRYQDGHELDRDLNGLFQICENCEIIGRSMAKRLEAAHLTGDAGINALVILHGFIQFMSILLDKRLDIVRPAFEPLLRHYRS